MRMSESVKEIAPALIAAQKEIVPVKRDKTNPFFKSSYVGLDTVLPEALRILNGHDLALIQTVGGADGGGTTLSTTILHSSGEWISDTQPLLLAKEDPQGQGSAITYARRYGLMSALGIVGEEDDDGNVATTAARRAPAARQAAPKRAQRPDPNAPGDGITGPQIKAIRAIIGDLFGKDAQAAHTWMQGVEPRACAGTVIHLAGLTAAEATHIIETGREAEMERDSPPQQEPLPVGADPGPARDA